MSHAPIRIFRSLITPATIADDIKALDGCLNEGFPERSVRSLLATALANTLRLYVGGLPFTFGVDIQPFSLGLYHPQPGTGHFRMFAGVTFEMESETAVKVLGIHAMVGPGAELDFFLSLITEIEDAHAKMEVFDTLIADLRLAEMPPANAMVS